MLRFVQVQSHLRKQSESISVVANVNVFVLVYLAGGRRQLRQSGCSGEADSLN